jgi:hypothetical protein
MPSIGLHNVDDLGGAFADDIVVIEFGAVFINIHVGEKDFATAILADSKLFKKRNQVLFLVVLAVLIKSVIKMTNHFIA